MTNRFTEKAKKVLSDAISAAHEFGHPFVGSEHLLLAAAKNSPKCFENTQITYERIRYQISSLAGIGDKSFACGEDMTPKCKKILVLASKKAASEGADEISVSHILISMLSEECVAKRIIEMEGASVNEILLSLGENKMFDLQETEKTEKRKKEKIRPTPFLDKNGTDLTEEAKKGMIEEIACREDEEERIIRILMRKSKNNPCLLGDAGVGKTAIAEAVAKRISEGRVPEKLKGMRVISVDISGVVAGTKYRGEFEEKLKNIINDAKNNNIILFVDELHTIVGAGSAEGSVDASNILKPSLARGDIHLIGATTPEEYRRIIEKDPALERRFQIVSVSEPDEEACIKMVMTVKKYYEGHHGIIITEDAVKAAVSIAVRCIPNRKLPDKAIDLLDEACSEAVMRNQSVIDEESIYVLAAAVTGIPISVITGNSRENCEKLKKALCEKLIFRDGVAERLTECYRRYANRKSSCQPPSSVMLYGHDGNGKTFTAEAFASEAKFSNIIRIDLNEYTEPHSISNLIGVPPGYGSSNGKSLAEKLKRNPFSAIIFDSVEKAHPDVSGIISKILTDGTITDRNDIVINAKNAFLILTCSPEGFAKHTGFSSCSESSCPLADKVGEVIYLEQPKIHELEKTAFARLYQGVKSRLADAELSSELTPDALDAEKLGKTCASAVKYADRLANELDISCEEAENGKNAVVLLENGKIKIKIPEKKA